MSRKLLGGKSTFEAQRLTGKTASFRIELDKSLATQKCGHGSAAKSSFEREPH